MVPHQTQLKVTPEACRGGKSQAVTRKRIHVQFVVRLCIMQKKEKRVAEIFTNGALNAVSILMITFRFSSRLSTNIFSFILVTAFALFYF